MLSGATSAEAVASLKELEAHLEAQPGEWEMLDGLMNVTISRFNRDRGVFEFLRDEVLERNIRLDGRKFDEIRPIWCEASVLPRVHGSVVFTRGETQALVTCTLGTADDEQKIEHVTGEYYKRFMLHYNVPPFSVGEVQFMSGADVERARHVEFGVRPEQDAGRVEEVEVGLPDLGGQRAVDPRHLSPGHPADHVPDRARPGEGGGLAGRNAELLEAVEQVVAAPAAEVRADLDLAALQADLGADRAIGDDLRLDWSSSQQRSELLMKNARTLADWVEYVRREEQTWHVDLVAHSMGGLVAMHTAISAPEIVAGLVLLNPALPLAPAPGEPGAVSDPDTGTPAEAGDRWVHVEL